MIGLQATGERRYPRGGEWFLCLTDVFGLRLRQALPDVDGRWWNCAPDDYHIYRLVGTEGLKLDDLADALAERQA
jgi:hypothetical protein